MTFFKKYIFSIIVILLVFFAIKPLINPGFFPIHDDEQVGRLFELNHSLESFHIPPRISQNLGFGYGYPFFNFYPSFVYYIAEVFVLLGFSYIISIKLMIGLGFMLSALFMYFFSKEYIGKLGGLISAVLYTYAPYHAVDVYVRGALPEFFSFAFIPAIFLVLLRNSRKQSIGNIVLFGLFVGGIILTHNLVALMAIPFITIYFIYLLIRSENKKALVISVLSGGILGLLISAYFWIPAILENKYTMVSLLTTELANYNLHFVSLPQFFNSPWGYGGSILGPQDGLSLEIGKIHIILASFAVVLFAFNIIKKKQSNVFILPFVIILILSVFLQSYYSKIIWDKIPALSYIQFPWRFMIFTVFSVSFLGGYIFSLKFDQKAKIILAAALVCFTILFYSSLFKPERLLLNAKDSDYISKEVIRWKTSVMAFEYVPFGIATKKSDLNTTIIDITEDEIARRPFEIITGDAKVKVLEEKPHYKKFEVISYKNTEFQINTYSFPGWKTFINGREISYNDKNKLKLLRINVKTGKSLVEAKFSDTNVRKIANLMSTSGLLIIIFLIPFYSKKINYDKA